MNDYELQEKMQNDVNITIMLRLNLWFEKCQRENKEDEIFGVNINILLGNHTPFYLEILKELNRTPETLHDMEKEAILNWVTLKCEQIQESRVSLKETSTDFSSLIGIKDIGKYPEYELEANLMGSLMGWTKTLNT